MSDPAPRETTPTLLIVDDDAHVRQSLVQLLTRTGAVCIEAEGGAYALAQLAKHEEIVLVISDVLMPQMDGIELLTRVRARWPDIGVMMITGLDNVKIAVHCLTLGAMDYLSKPFQGDEVQVRVRNALDKRRLTVERRRYQERLENTVALQAKRLDQVFLASIQSLSNALEAKDAYTRGHSDRVSSYATTIATEMNLSAAHRRQVTLGCHVHDVGKIGVREEVLHKPGKLTDEEYTHVMAHPMIGWHILESLLDEEPIALSIIRSHHERFDGTGLPDRLGGSDISREARIASVADCLDAMTSARPYRPAMAFDDAVREVVRCSGTQFDPDVVMAFLRAVKSGRLAFAPRVTDTVV